MLRSSALVLLPLALGSCTMMAPNATTVDGLFLQSVTGSNLFEIQSSQVALNRSTNAQVRTFAQQMINEHTTAQAQVAALASARGVPLPKALPPELQLKVNTLNTLTGSAFDVAYLREQVLGHQFTISIFQNEQTAGRDAGVVAFATQNLPLIERHFQEAQTLLATAQSQTAPAAPATPSTP
ncbi:DUF4142 domain-containing protein [Deinococcus sp. SDU3-2]|uniref:DUF4142 domain-containing protein n=1 Tax=Deinococcus terrestris TaxID=2651870 RepID=A0A7X1NV28_9DEIO|nr:DUF4142 domain-containing protein [Deinococcus terrestris]MPY66331.1 DUF4142 domain-containing protein [Deinococcus terrestris]